ncbi:hypothetical protein GGX14DRAFT_588894 [Mycena pura]|uniref:Uncharacterized protein n=1 Tax=Mycena pura TaxID=153505 RepID=A0AAD6UVJ7_9AGAR|nr:hypothetical protein GGX14DRAFT_588894 [Mycena pura]
MRAIHWAMAWAAVLRRTAPTSIPTILDGVERYEGIWRGRAVAGEAVRASTTSDWDASMWKPKTYSIDNPPAASAASPTNTSSHDAEGSMPPKVSAWGQSENGGKSGWGDTSDAGGWGGAGGGASWGNGATSGWGDATSSGWGTGGEETAAALATAPKPGPVPAASGRSTGAGTTTGWGGGTAGGWGDAAATPATTTGWNTESAPGRSGGTAEATSGWGATMSASWTLEPKTAPAPILSRPKDLQLDTNSRVAVDAPPPPQSASSYRANSVDPFGTPNTATSPQSAFPSLTAPCSEDMTRSQIHSGIVKNFVRVTRIRLELDELKRQLSEWKTVQLSPQFHRVSTRTGDHLNTIRRELTSQISTVEARLKAAENDLLSFPELPSSVPTDIADIDKETMDFTVELERWVTSFTGYVERETGRPSASSSTSNMDVDTQPDSAVPRVVDVMKRVKELEERLEEMDEQIFYAQISFHQERSADNAVQAVHSKRDDGLGREKAAGESGLVCELRDLVDGADSNMRREAERVVLLIESHEQANQRIATLEAQQVQHRRLKEEMQLQLEQLEQQKQQRGAQLQLMREQVARFAQRPDTAPILDRAVLTHVQETIKAMIDEEIVPALKALGVQYTEAIQQRMNSLQESIQPALDETEAICRRAEMTQSNI